MVTAVPVPGHPPNAIGAPAPDPGAAAAPLDWGREVCRTLAVAETREWLVTNGLGGYAAGTIAGLHTRRYHGLLIAALKPPLGRTLLVSKLDETATYLDHEYRLAANRWASGVVDPTGFQHLERFHREGTTPVWTFACADALLEKRVWMQQGANTTYVRYHLYRATAPLTLNLTALVNYRDYHGDTHAGNWRMHVETVEHGLRVTAFEGATPFYLLSDHAEATPLHDWYRGFYLQAESDRGLAAGEDHLCVGHFRVTLQPGESVTLVASTDAAPALDGAAAAAEQQTYEQQLIARGGHGAAPSWVRHLMLAADQFVVRRPLSDDATGSTIIAGYPWFGDWGRDTMISLPGLTLVTRRPHLARRILSTFARFVDQGMLPNRFLDAGEAPEYNTVDAALWYLEAIRAYHAATGDDDLVQELFPVLHEIIAWHQRGTRYHIHVDPSDGLLYSGEEGVQLTWMDARVGDWVVTPRSGKAVDVNALWYNGLRAMAAFARRLSQPSEMYEALADRAEQGFARFWNDERGDLYDVIDGPAGSDAALRPNQLWAVALTHSPLDAARQRAVVDVCARHLLTSHGLRSLAAGDPAYVGHYGGDQRQRDGAYHQGTVWAWLLGPFVSAHLRAYRDPVLARSFLLPLVRHLADHGVGSISEIFDGDAPFVPNGCFAQAWSVAALLQAWQATEVER
jgi:predicted glycogen debranching enzyme